MSASDEQPSGEDCVPPEASVPTAEVSAQSVDLTIVAHSPLTEVRLLNARLEQVTLPSNAGTVHVAVPPGLYEAGFRSAAGWDIVSVLVTGDKAAEQVLQPVAADPSPASVAQSLTDFSTETLTTDADSVIFSITAKDTAAFPAGHVHVGLIGQNEDGLTGTASISGATCTWRFAAAPGHWRLRVDERDMREPYELPITVVDGYRIVASAVTSSVDDLWHVDLLTFRLRMAGDEDEFEADQMAKLEEQALSVLQSGQQLYGDSIDTLLSQLANMKKLNPLLGLLAGLLAVNLGKGSKEFRQRSLDRLETLLNHNVVPHPDLAVLRLHLRIEKQLPIDALEQIPFPPLLAPSWRLLLEIARTYPALIPADSLTDRIADRLWPNGLWVIWTSPPIDVPKTIKTPDGVVTAVQAATLAAGPTATPVSAESKSLSPIEAAQLPFSTVGYTAQTQTVVDTLADADVSRQVRDLIEGQEGDGKGVAWDDDAVLTPSEAAIANILDGIAKSDAETKTSHFKRTPLDLSNILDPTTLSKSLGLPDTTVMRSMGSLASKIAGLGKIES